MTLFKSFSPVGVILSFLVVVLATVILFVGFSASAQSTNLPISATTTIVAFGDSLVYGVGSTSGNDFVSVLSSRIGHPIINAGIPGDTTSSALARVDRDVLSRDPDIVIILLGGNDILVNLPQANMFNNLRATINRIKSSGAKVILLGIFSNNTLTGMGYTNLASETGVYYIPDALEGVIGNPLRTSSDDLFHPNDRGYALIADRVYPVVQRVIADNPSLQTNSTGSSSGNSTSTPGSIVNPELTGSCGVDIGQPISGAYRISWSANAYNLDYSSTTEYIWTGSDSFSATGAYTQKQYFSPGLKTATVTIKNGSRSISLACSADVHSNMGQSVTTSLGASCYPNVSGSQVSWSVIAYGGTGPITYQWSGDGISSATTTATTTIVTVPYSTPGIKTANVRAVSGSEYIDLSCQAKVASSTPGAGHCFIATAAFGTYMEPQVVVLRNFRDQTLLKNPLGRLFVKTYYTVSPPLADFIRARPSLRLLVRLELTPWIFILEHAGYSNTLVSA